MSAQQVKAAEFLRKAAEALESSDLNGNQTPRTAYAATPSRDSITATVRNLFAPYRGRSQHSQVSNKRRQPKLTPASYWTHRFCLLAKSSQDVAPTKEDKQLLFEAGLGEKRITFVKDSSPDAFREKLEEEYPDLRGCGGFELLRSNCGSRVALEVLRMPPAGFSSLYLANKSNLGQAMCYIRPIQKDIDLVEGIEQADNEVEAEVETIKEECINCRMMVPLAQLRSHSKTCGNFIDEDEQPKEPKQRKTESMCQDKCQSSIHSEEQNYNSMNASVTREEVCPICEKRFPVNEISWHAASCGETSCLSNLTNSKIRPVEQYRCSSASSLKLSHPFRSLLEKLNTIKEDIEAKTETNWNIKVVRRLFSTTSIEQLEESEPEDWNKTIKVSFIGEEGVDSGGLFREFFTLLFRETKVFEGNTFSFDPDLLAKKRYCLMGKAVATAIVNGHPGPRCLSKHVTAYILEGKEPEYINTEDIQRADIRAVIQQIEDATQENISAVYSETMSVLQETGYSQVLTYSNKGKAVQALKGHYLLYRGMASINQFMEGLKLHNCLQLLQLHINEACTYLCEDIHPTADEVASFFKPIFSGDADQKASEEVIMYNWHKFLKKVEKNKITSQWTDIHADDCNEPDVSINMAHVLQALLGCSRLPMNIDCGLIEFDHSSLHLPKVNTCAPSISFSKVKDIQSYDTFEEIMLYIIVGSYGFGSA